MNDSRGLVTLAAYVTAAMLIVLVALLGVFQYGAKSRVSSMKPVPTDPAPELAAAGLQLSTGTQTPSTTVSGLAQQRIRLLETMLSDKTELVRQQAGRISRQTTDLEELRQRFDDAMLMAIESLPTADTNRTDTTVDPPEESDAAPTDPDR